MTKDSPCRGICPGEYKKKDCMKNTRISHGSFCKKILHWYRGENASTKIWRRQAPRQICGKLGLCLYTNTPSMLECSGICGLPRKNQEHRTPSLTCVASMALVISDLLFCLAEMCQLTSHALNIEWCFITFHCHSYLHVQGKAEWSNLIWIRNNAV